MADIIHFIIYMNRSILFDVTIKCIVFYFIRKERKIDNLLLHEVIDSMITISFPLCKLHCITVSTSLLRHSEHLPCNDRMYKANFTHERCRLSNSDNLYGSLLFQTVEHLCEYFVKPQRPFFFNATAMLL